MTTPTIIFDGQEAFRIEDFSGTGNVGGGGGGVIGGGGGGGGTGGGGGGSGGGGASLPNRMPLSVGTTYYVDPFLGNDSNNSSQAQSPSTPWLTLPHAVSVKGTEPGATISIIGDPITLLSYVNGPYAIQLIGVTNDPTNPLTIKANTPFGVTVASADGHSGGFTIGAYIYQCTGVRVEGFIFSVGGGAPPGSIPVQVEDCNRIEISGNILRDNGGQPVIRGGVGRPSTDIWWFQNLHNVNGVDTSGGYFDVRGTHQLYDGQESSSYSGSILSGTLRTVIACNILNGTVPGYGVQCGPQSVQAYVVCNTIYENQPSNYLAGDGVVLFDQGGPYRTNGCVVANNLVVKCHGSAVAGPAGGPETGNIVQNNMAWDNDCSWANNSGFPLDTEYPQTNTVSGPTMYSLGSGNLPNADPLFTNPSGGDFSLQSGSPAKGAGLPAFTPGVDFFGNPRSPTAPSLGAVE